MLSKRRKNPQILETLENMSDLESGEVEIWYTEVGPKARKAGAQLGTDLYMLLGCSDFL